MKILTNFSKSIYLKLFGRYKLSSLLSKELGEGWKILDVGCGRASPLAQIRDRKKIYIVGLDNYGPYLTESKKLSIHNEYFLGDARSLTSIFEPKSFDCAIATEVLEHLDKDDGRKMIEQLEKISKQKIILTTPNGFLPTYAGPRDNPEEKHLSGWTYNELKEFGFRIYGLNGLKILWTIRNGQAIPRIRLPILSSLLIDISEVVVYYCPKLAFQFLFIKDLRNK